MYLLTYSNILKYLSIHDGWFIAFILSFSSESIYKNPTQSNLTFKGSILIPFVMHIK